MRTLIVDGTNIFIINYTANPSLDINGNPIGGVVGTLKSLAMMAHILKPEKIIVVLDGSGGSVQKRAFFKEYKEGRKPLVVGRNYKFVDENHVIANKKYQTSLLLNILDFLPICTIVTDGCEADDAIAYIVNNGEYFGHRSHIIASCDKDFFQLVNEKVVIFNPQSKKLLTDNSIVEEYGIHPKNWLFYRAITGDPSDNLKGIKGVGPKTLLKCFALGNPNADSFNVETIHDFFKMHEENTGLGWELRKKTSIKLVENKEIIERNWKLMSLRDPMMSLNSKDKVSRKIQNFVPSLKKKEFYIEVMRLGGLGINFTFTQAFIGLLKK